MSRTLRRAAVALLATLTLLAAAGCGSDAEPGSAATPSASPTPSESPIDSPSGSPTASPSASPTKKPAGKVVEIDLTSSEEPRKVKVSAGKAFTLHIVSDEPGELHVHSTPETYVDFNKGTTNKKLTIEQPGVVDVEDHATDALVVQLEVR